jgi:hypothetical protein
MLISDMTGRNLDPCIAVNHLHAPVSVLRLARTLAKEVRQTRLDVSISSSI